MFYIVCDRIHAPALCLLLACLIDGIEDLFAELLKLFLRVRTEVEADLSHRNDGMDSLEASCLHGSHRECSHRLLRNLDLSDLRDRASGRMDRVCYLRESAAGMSADAVEVNLVCLDSGRFIGDLLKSRAVNGNAGIQLRMVVYIILHSF